MPADKTTPFTIEVDLSEAIISTANPRIVENVAILGPVSVDAQGKVRRRYTPECLQQAVSVFEGAPAYADHPDKSKIGQPRSIRDLFGYYKGVHANLAEGKLRGSLHVIANELGNHVLAVIKDNPQLAGNSICASGRIRMENGVQVVEQIMARSAHGRSSVDLVVDPATTKSIFESTNENTEFKESKMDLQNLTIAGLCESRKDLHDKIFQDGAASRKAEIDKLTADLAESKGKVTQLTTEVDTLKVKVALSESRTLVDKLLAEAQLPAAALTDVFRNTLYNVRESKQGDKVVTVEEQVKALIEDRRVSLGLTGVFNNGNPSNPLGGSHLNESKGGAVPQGGTTLSGAQVIASIGSFRN